MGAGWLKCSCCSDNASEPPPPSKKVALQELLVTVDEEFARILPTIEGKIESDILVFSPDIAHKATAERDTSALVPRLYFSRAEIDGFCDLLRVIAPALYQYYTRRIAAVECSSEILSVVLANSAGYVGGLFDVVSGSFSIDGSNESGWSSSVCKNVAKRFGFSGAKLGERFLFAVQKETLSHNPADQIIKAMKFLGLKPSAALKDLKSIFQKLVRKYHPNKSPNPQLELFICLLESYMLVWFYLHSD
jgi:hypothetical protein